MKYPISTNSSALSPDSRTDSNVRNVKSCPMEEVHSRQFTANSEKIGKPFLGNLAPVEESPQPTAQSYTFLILCPSYCRLLAVSSLCYEPCAILVRRPDNIRRISETSFKY